MKIHAITFVAASVFCFTAETKNLNATKGELFMPMVSQQHESGKPDKSIELARCGEVKGKETVSA